MLAMSIDYKYFAIALWELKKILIWNLEQKAIKMDLALSEIEKEVSFMYF
jgi:predicted transcriptional regulator